MSGLVERLFGEAYDKFIAEGNGYRYFLQPIEKIHLTSELEDELRPAGSIRSIRIFGAIACFILFLACINFINLSTALSVERAREVGIRKTFGSRRTGLIRQFLFESVLFCFASMLVAMLLAFLLMPLLNKIAGNDISFTWLLHPLRLLLLLIFSILIGVVAGLYPAFVLSSLNPMMVLKGRFKYNKRGIALRNGLVIFQFAVSAILIICTVMVNKQMQFMLGDKLGFRRDNIIFLDGLSQLRALSSQGTMVDARQSFIDEISKIAGVEEVTKCSGLPGKDESGGGATWVALETITPVPKK